ncbi:cytochrome C [Prosthecochloris marina]|uniref:Cytochrome C n=1 Tax=Prosthecochloris marina TaxID=2017681 RepID=A0A317T917_9CHLB|nr:cytochrome c [Prosthecochloris marina]PWW82227.1 cytochrome C [Prosthecochloris marina]
MKKVLYFCILTAVVSGLALSEGIAQTPDGEEVFNKNCSVCHSVNPPPKSAPPVVRLANLYHLKFSTKEEGVANMAAFLKKPDHNKAAAVQAISRYGLMPAIPLSDEELNAVAEWVWDQYDPAMRRGRGAGGGMRQQINQ